MNSGMSRPQLESFGRGPALLAIALRQFPKKMWLYKPSLDRWCIHEIILHLADSEASAYVWCRQLIVEPGSITAKFDAGKWAGTLGYFHQSNREALKIICHLRRMTYQLLLTLPDPVWESTAQHPAQDGMSLAQWMDIQERHIPCHINQMKRNYQEWLQIPPRSKPVASYWRSNPSMDQSSGYANRFKRQG
ncbi:MAG: DinB family protein [Candidatus Acidiferrales bacterium]